MKKITCFIILLLISILASCSKEEKTAGVPFSQPSGPSGEAGGPVVNTAPPEVTSGVIVPPQPTADKPLGVQYIGRNPKGEPVQYKFRWYVDNRLVQEGPNATLEPGEYKKGSAVYVEIVPSDSFSSGSPFKTGTATILNQPPVIPYISLSPLSAAVGAVITAVPAGTDPDGDRITYAYQWRVNGTVVAESKNNEFNTTGLHKKDLVSVVVTPSDGEATGMPVQSGGIRLSNAAPQITSTPPTSFANGVYTYQVTAKDSDGDDLTFSLLKSPPGMTIDRSTGLIRWEQPQQTAAGKEEVTVEVSVDDRDGGKAVQEFSFTIEK